MTAEAAALYRLMTWLSPAFPVGAFSYSSGIEWAVEAGDIADAASLRDWLAAMLADGPGFCDGVFLAHAHRAASAGDDAALARYRGTGGRLRAVARTPARDLDAGPRLHRDRARGLELRRARPDDLAVATARSSIPSRSAWSAPRMRSRWRRRCMPSCTRWCRTGFRPARGWFRSGKPTASACWPRSSRSSPRPQPRACGSLDDLGSATFRADLASMRHETQYTRLFRS